MCFMYVLQFSNGWSYGEQMCEISKSHPLLKPYKGLSEKVVCRPRSEFGFMLLLFLAVLQHSITKCEPGLANIWLHDWDRLWASVSSLNPDSGV